MTFYAAMQENAQQEQRIRVIALDQAYLGQQALICEDKWVYADERFPKDSSLLEAAVQKHQASVMDMESGRFFIEPLAGGQRMIICGGGHISLAIIPIAKMLKFSVCVIDDRLYFANKAREACADEVVCAPFAEAIRKLQEGDRPYYVIATRGHQHDQECLKEIAKYSNQYVGMIGSRRRVKMIKEMLENEGISNEFLEKLHAPIGLPIAAKTPAEIAISILGQIIEEKNKLGGSIDFAKEMFQALEEYQGQSLALATIISRKGSAPREIGAKMLVLPNGDCIDTIGGGCVEAEVRQRALQCMKDKQSTIETVDMTAEQAEEEGMVCGGVVDVLIQCIENTESV